jgi:ParB-like chromosome segregation protein Spo0J
MEEVDPATLIANPKNWRVHPQHQADSMRAVFESIGWTTAVTVNERTGVIIDGHLRVSLAIEQGMETVPVLFVKVSDAEEKQVLATFDVIAGMAQKDEAKYQALVDEIGMEENIDRVVLDLIDESNLAGKRRKNPALTAECAISPELHERQDYLLFVMDNEFDWANLCAEFGVETVVSAQVGKCSAGRRGLGRVIQGKVLIAKLAELRGRGI